MRNTNNLVLEDGSNIAVIGGGPSGSFFTYFALQHADRFGLDINIDIIEAKNFTCDGPLGCNHCGGIVSESLIQLLSAEGIVLPSKVIRKGIETYTLHFEQGSTIIEASVEEQRIASMFRGLGPKGCTPSGQTSFDDYLLGLCVDNGAKVIYDRVTDIVREDGKVSVRTKEGVDKTYDLVVGAVGLSQKTLQLFENVCPGFVAPETTRTFICEIHMTKGQINKYFGNSMHVFLLNLENIKFGALIPKANYVTLVLLGKDINKDIVESFLHSSPVKKCFPTDFDLEAAITCKCYPYINIKRAKSAFSDRVVLIGDSATSKLYKNGIGAAYITAKAAANTVIFEGISEAHFKKYFQTTCTKLEFDNNIGKFIFMVTTVIQKSGILKGAMLNMVIDEQKDKKQNRHLSSILWDTFTGSAPYNDIFLRFLYPKVIILLIWNIVLSVFKKIKA